MQTLHVTLSLLLFFFSISFGAVVEISNENFEEVLSQNEKMLVLVFSPDCPFSKEMLPEFRGASKKEGALPMGIINAKKEASLLGSLKVQGFPTTIFFYQGTMNRYTGGREKKEILAWMNKRKGEFSKELNSLEEVDEFIGTSGLKALFVGDLERTEKRNYELAALNLIDEGFKFAHVDSEVAGVAEKLQIVKKPSIVIFREASGTQEGFQKIISRKDVDPDDFEMSQEFIVKSISDAKFPELKEFDEQVALRIFGKNLESVVLFGESTDPLMEKAKKELVNSTFMSKLELIYVYTDSKPGKLLMDFLSLKQRPEPFIEVLRFEAEELRQFPFNERNITARGLSQFFFQYRKQEIFPVLRTEEPEKKELEAIPGQVTPLVGATFKKFLLKFENKDVLVLFYSTKSQSSIEFRSLFKKIAEQLGGSPSLAFGEINGDANEIEGTQVQVYPTIIMRPYEKTVERYSGVYSEEAILEWIRSNVGLRIRDESKKEL